MIATRLLVAVVLSTALLDAARGGAVLYVDDDAPPSGDGLSWATAYDSLQGALADAAGGGISEIRVAQGVYTPADDGISDCCTPSGDPGCDDPACEAVVCGVLPPCCVNGWDATCVTIVHDLCTVCEEPRNETFQLLNGVVLAGGYAGVGTPNPDARDVAVYVTLLSGDVAGDDGPEPFANNGDNSYHVVTGSGTDQTAALDGFTITGGNADGGGFDGAGGGILNSNGSPTVGNCTFCGNMALFGGGGMVNLPGNPTVSNCTFSGNTADAGAGMLNESSSPTLTSCTFSGNSACDGGGAIASFNSSPMVTNCTFSGNLGGSFGGGGIRDEMSSTTVTNCTFAFNAALNGNAIGLDAGSSMSIANCILWDDGDEIWNVESVITVAYSDVQGGWPGIGNIDADPMFTETKAGDFRLSRGSPCVDAGDNNAVPEGIATDLDGNPRFVDDPDTVDTGNGTPPVVDMGAFEFQTSPCPWDCGNGDGQVTTVDFLALLGQWGQIGTSCDFGEGNPGVDTADFLELLAKWGPCP